MKIRYVSLIIIFLHLTIASHCWSQSGLGRVGSYFAGAYDNPSTTYSGMFTPKLILGAGGANLKFCLEADSQEVGDSFYSSLLDLSPIELQLQDTAFWWGGFGLDLGSPSSSFMGEIKFVSSLPRELVFESSGGPSVGSVVVPIIAQYDGLIRSWRGVDASWRRINMSFGYRHWGSVGFLFGFDWERITCGMTEPTPYPATSLIPVLSTIRSRINSVGGDLSIRNVSLYLGMKASRGGLKASIGVGPAWTNVQLPLYLHNFGIYRLTINPGPRVYQLLDEGAEYSFTSPGILIKGDFEYGRAIAPGVYFALWADLNYVGAKGSGSLDLKGSSSWIDLGGPPIPLRTDFSASGSGSSTLKTFSYTGGFSASVAF